MVGITIHFFVTSYIIASATAAYVCEPETCDPGTKHTLCLYDGGLGEACHGAYSNVLSAEQQQALLNAHNDYRALVASGGEERGLTGPQPAGEIPPLQWDDELAMIAQVYINQCINGHSACDDVERFKVNQNIAFMSKSDKYVEDITEMLDQWTAEAANYDGNYIDNMQEETNGKIYHWTQLVWADTQYVGCGVFNWQEDNGWYSTRLICEYGPAGNYPGLPIYPTN
ncbi:venom allergen 5-like [Microplitis mediator]|uniref:venom allergen 5-like n=1 Tax=Microplitis mediator TaxID=375433 RepID=UPI00255702FC|nr:venom allergen 5-like [Microplitis mediator]